MRLSVEVGHPAHVHYWRNVINILRTRGHEVTVFAREKEITIKLLRAYGLKYETVGRSRPVLLAKAIGVGIDDLRVLRAAHSKGIELLLSTGIPGSAHASRVLGVPHIALIDTEIATLGRLLTEPFSDAVCTPECFQGRIDPAKHIRFRGYLELMYLHPAYFRPDPSILDAVGVTRDERYAVVRFSSWNSSHDLRRNGSILGSHKARLDLIRGLAEHYRVFVSSEIPLPSAFEPFCLKIPPERLHDFLAFASLYVGEGATMASEAGVLGVPWIYVSQSPRSYLADQERRYGLGRSAGSLDEALSQVNRWSNQGTRAEWARKRERLLADSVDVSRFMADLVEGWPEHTAASGGKGHGG